MVSYFVFNCSLIKLFLSDDDSLVVQNLVLFVRDPVLDLVQFVVHFV